MNRSRSAAEDELLDAVQLWWIAPGAYAGEVIDAATECLVAGLDTEALRELAGASVRDSRLLLDPLILKTIDELTLNESLGTDSQLSAMLVQARRLGVGRITPRQLVSWAHKHIGHEGSDECQRFVNFYYTYDEAEYVGLREAEVDDMVRQEADALLSGDSSPGLSPQLPLLPDVEVGRTDEHHRGWLRRLGRRLRRS